VIKVWVQVELGRYTMASGNTTMQAINETPGPGVSIGGSRVNWLAIYWLLMFLVSLGQLGGIVGSVGQGMAISLPLTQGGRAYNAAVDARTKLDLKMYLAQASLAKQQPSDNERQKIEAQIAADKEQIAAYDLEIQGTKEQPGLVAHAHDDQYWATIISLITAVVLVVGRYKIVEVLSTVLVAGFTFVSVFTVIALQLQPAYAITSSELLEGLSFHLPPHSTKDDPIVVALATLGIIGVGANELIQYPYWCLEKGYARFTGPHDKSPQWAERALGWMRVLKWDAWCSMVVYTFATVCFYFLGAAVLGRLHLIPADKDMIRTLAVMYEPVFGPWTPAVFLIGAFAVLYSTFLIANAGQARVCADAMFVFRGLKREEKQERRWVQIFSGVFPLLCLAIYIYYPVPKALVLASGAMQAIMLPMLSFTAIYFRYRRIDQRVAPGKAWDVFLWLSGIVMLITGVWLTWARGQDLVGLFWK
jgi:Mn2+/Fe2+ NRAMP family transporter